VYTIQQINTIQQRKLNLKTLSVFLSFYFIFDFHIVDYDRNSLLSRLLLGLPPHQFDLANNTLPFLIQSPSHVIIAFVREIVIQTMERNIYFIPLHLIPLHSILLRSIPSIQTERKTHNCNTRNVKTNKS
jgi:hypothetical protein